MIGNNTLINEYKDEITGLYGNDKSETTLDIIVRCYEHPIFAEHEQIGKVHTLVQIYDGSVLYGQRYLNEVISPDNIADTINDIKKHIVALKQ